MKEFPQPNLDLLNDLTERFIKSAEKLGKLAANSRPNRKLRYTQKDFDKLKKPRVFKLLLEPDEYTNKKDDL